MEEKQLGHLRKKQIIYTNIIYLFYFVVVAVLLLVQASALVVYSILGVIFLLSPISLWLTKRPNPLLLLFPKMKDLIDYEREKLGTVGRKYFISGMIMQLILSGYCFFQAIIRGDVPFSEGIPWWYLLIVFFVLIYIGNLNLRFHIRRFDKKNTKELSVYAKDQTLFTLVFAAVFLVFVIIGSFLVFVVFR